MPLTQRSRLPLLLLLAPALLLAAIWWQRGAGPAAAGGAEPAPPRTRATPRASTAPLARQRVPEARPAAAVSAGLPLNRRLGFEATADLYDYAQALAGAAQAGDAEAGWMLSRVYDYCAAYAIDPLGYADDSRALSSLGSPGVDRMQQARQRVASRCSGFSPSDGLSAQRIVQQRQGAAREGNLAAEAALLSLGQPLERSRTYKRDLVQRVLASRDPEAYLALSTAMGVAASGDDAFLGLVAGDQFAELAWQLAACRLGLDCGPGSALMTSYCASGGICSQDAAQDFADFVFDAAVPRQGARKMDEMVSALINGAGEMS